MYDVVIAGSGIVGLVNGLWLAKNTALRIAFLDVKVPQQVWSEREYDSRVYAITPASQQRLEMLQVWPQLAAKRVSPFTRMQVWDSPGGGELTFDHAQLKVPVLGHIIEENLLHTALLQRLADFPQVDLLCPLMLTSLQEQEDYLELHYQSPLQADASGQAVNQTLRTKLLIGADGAQSWVRAQAGISLHCHDYQHTALTARVETTEPHRQTARQVFLTGNVFPKGPLAFLPLLDAHHCSIVWSTTPAEAEQLLAQDEQTFQTVLTQALASRLGSIKVVTKRQAFALQERHAERYVKKRLALIGDAAHTLHPLAGQGVNLGLADAWSLAEVIVDAVKKRRDFASLSILRRYERARRGENAIMLHAVKLLKSLFARDSLTLLRNQGMIVTDHFKWLKNNVARYAMGIEGL